jgi:phosphatidylserine synthase
MERKGEKLGWTLGWIGAFLWILAFSIMWLFQENFINGFLGLLIFIIAIYCILKFAPWKYPQTKYWKLMLPIYFIFIIGIVFLLIALLTSWKEMIYIQYGFWLIPCFIPLLVLGRKTWQQT